MKHYVRDEADKFEVAAAAYRDDEVFEAELRNIFYSTWIYLGHDTEIPGRGDYKTAWIGRQPVILVRGEDGRLGCFLNYCTHRGAALCREAYGNTRAFVCPYHAWSFGISGELIATPAPDRYSAAFKPSDRNLRPVAKIGNYSGLIFGSLNPDVPSLEVFLGEAKRYVDLWLARCAGGRYRIAPAAHKYSYRGNWKFQSENSVDGYHAAFVHQSAFNAFKKFEGTFPNRSYLTRNSGCTRGMPGGHATLEAGAVLESGFTSAADRQAYWDALTRINGEDGALAAITNRHLLIFPSLLLMDGNIRVVQPVTRDYTEVYSYPALIEGVPDSVVAGRLRDVQMRIGTAGMLNPDDVDVFAGIQNGLSGPGGDSIVLERGLGMEQVLPSGERIGAFNDETSQRSFWRQWQAMLAVPAAKAVS